MLFVKSSGLFLRESTPKLLQDLFKTIIINTAFVFHVEESECSLGLEALVFFNVCSLPDFLINDNFHLPKPIDSDPIIIEPEAIQDNVDKILFPLDRNAGIYIKEIFFEFHFI